MRSLIPLSLLHFLTCIFGHLFLKGLSKPSSTIGLILAVISLLMTGLGWKHFLQIILFIIKKFPPATILTASVLKFHLTIIHQETEKFCIAQFEKDLFSHLVLFEMQLKYSALPGSSSLFCCGLLIHILAKRFLQLGGLDKTFFCIYIKWTHTRHGFIYISKHTGTSEQMKTWRALALSLTHTCPGIMDLFKWGKLDLWNLPIHF